MGEGVEAMSELLTLRLRTPAPLAALTGQRVEVWYDFVRTPKGFPVESKLAVLLCRSKKTGEELELLDQWWFPKSLILIDGQRLPGKSNCEVPTDAKVFSVE